MILSQRRSAIENLFSPFDPAKMLEYKLEAQVIMMVRSSIMKLSKLALYFNSKQYFVMYCAITRFANGTFQFCGVTASPIVIFTLIIMLLATFRFPDTGIPAEAAELKASHPSLRRC